MRKFKKNIMQFCSSLFLTGTVLILFSFGYNHYPVVTFNGQIEGEIEQVSFVKTDRLIVANQYKNPGACDIQSYILYVQRPGDDPCEYTAEKGSKFNEKVAKAIKLAESGWKYTFFEMMVHCKGEKESMKVNNLSFKIK